MFEKCVQENKKLIKCKVVNQFGVKVWYLPWGLYWSLKVTLLRPPWKFSLHLTVTESELTVRASTMEGGSGLDLRTRFTTWLVLPTELVDLQRN